MKLIKGQSEHFTWGTSLTFSNESALPKHFGLDEPLVNVRLVITYYDIKQALERAVTRSLALHRPLLLGSSLDKAWVILSADQKASAEFGFNLRDSKWEGESVSLNEAKPLVLAIAEGMTHGVTGMAQLLEIKQEFNVPVGLEAVHTEAEAKALLAQKPWAVKSLANYPNIYQLPVATLVVASKPTQVYSKCLVVDLNNLSVYQAEDELVKLSNFLILTLPKAR